jgi:hypothetical protein
MINTRARHQQIAKRRLLFGGSETRRRVVDAEFRQGLFEINLLVGDGDAVESAHEALAHRMDLHLPVDVSPTGNDASVLHDEDRR